MLGIARVSLELLLRVHVRFFSFVNLAMALASWIILMRAARRTANPKLRSQVRTIRFGLGVSLLVLTSAPLDLPVGALRAREEFFELHDADLALEPWEAEMLLRELEP